MDFKLMKSFLRDHLSFTMAYFSGILLIGVFFAIDTGERPEIIYPFLIALFVYLVWILIQFTEYYRFYKGLPEMGANHDYSKQFHHAIHIRAQEQMKKLHMDYMDKLSVSDLNRNKERRFLSMWIHNMKAPITVTDLLIQRMEQEELDTKTGIQALKEEKDKLLNNLDTVLNIIRLEDFAKDYVPEQIDLLKELNKIINKNKNLFIYNRVYPKVITDLSEASVLSDLKWNELLITQLISNAVKYSKAEEGISKNIYFLIKIDTNELHLIIQDEGIGIPKHDLEKIYEPFFTGDNGRKGYQSSGIGLYFCREICRQLGHTLTITSEVGVGTIATVSYLSKL